MAAERECHTRPPQTAVGRERHPQQLAVESTTAAQCCEVGPAAARIDQALSRCRPLRRRAFTIARPARVDMRWRKPWRRARLRLWGWYVRFTLEPPGGSGRGQVREMRCGDRSVPGCRPESTDSLRVPIPSDARRGELTDKAVARAARAKTRSARARSHIARAECRPRLSLPEQQICLSSACFTGVVGLSLNCCVPVNLSTAQACKDALAAVTAQP